ALAGPTRRGRPMDRHCLGREQTETAQWGLFEGRDTPATAKVLEIFGPDPLRRSPNRARTVLRTSETTRRPEGNVAYWRSRFRPGDRHTGWDGASHRHLGRSSGAPRRTHVGPPRTRIARRAHTSSVRALYKPGPLPAHTRQ